MAVFSPPGLRKELVRNLGDSKLVSICTCPGSPVNVYEPLNIELGPTGTASKMCLELHSGAFTFIADWQYFFRIGNDVVVGLGYLDIFVFEELGFAVRPVVDG